MKKTIISVKISKLKLNYNWYSFLHFITKKKLFFDKKVKTGIMILSLMTLLANCQNETNQSIKKSELINKSKISVRKSKKDVDATEVLKINQRFYAPEIVDTIAYSEEIFSTCYMPSPRISKDTTSYGTIQYAYNSDEIDEQPIFPGGELEIQDYIIMNLIVPDEKKDIEGTVFVQFVVNNIGKVEQVSIYRGLDSVLDKEAIKVISTLPEWKPGEIRGEPVNVFQIVPVKFEPVKDSL
jgi:TonB family protein